jgi:hypothetical protein
MCAFLLVTYAKYSHPYRPIGPVINSQCSTPNFLPEHHEVDSNII